MKVIVHKIRSLYHSTVFLLLVSEFLHIFSFFWVCLCRHFVCFSSVSRPRTQILSLFILAAILNKFPLSVDKSVTWFLLCARVARVFSPAAAILESEKTLGTRLRDQARCGRCRIMMQNPWGGPRLNEISYTVRIPRESPSPVYLWSNDLWHHIRLRRYCSVLARSTKMDARCYLVSSLS